MHELDDKAGRVYWDQIWQSQPIPAAVNPRAKNRRYHLQRSLHEYFRQVLGNISQGRQAVNLLEIGAARSVWLPYFAKEFGFQVAGLDYSELGCQQARAILEREGVNGRVVHADFTEPPKYMVEAFDVVVSFGVVEHFTDTAACIEQLSRFLKPGGRMIALIPNLTGSVGWLEKRVCRATYDVHVPLDRQALKQAHERAGLTVLSCQYFMGGGFTSLNFACQSENPLYPAIRRVPAALSMPFWFLDRLRANIRPNRLTSPYVICLAQK